MYDTDATGRVHYEDFRNMAEQFGMQLDDDSLLALYNIYDPEGTGYLAYHDLAKHLMDKGGWLRQGITHMQDVLSLMDSIVFTGCASSNAVLQKKPTDLLQNSS
jgi:hypothetical protein